MRRKGKAMTIRLPIPLYKMIENEAIKEGLNTSEHVRNILRRHLTLKPRTDQELYDKSHEEGQE